MSRVQIVDFKGEDFINAAMELISEYKKMHASKGDIAPNYKGQRERQYELTVGRTVE